MPLEVGLWRVDGSKPEKITPSGVPLESQLEAMIEADPTILGTPLLLIGRQVPTDYGKFIDLLAVDDEGALHVLELKRDKTPREVIAQALDYGSWVQSLSHNKVLDLFDVYKPGMAFEEAWTDTFGGNPPDELNTAHRLTVVASDVDPATERIVGYLNGFEVPVVFFRYFNDGDRAYLARTWLLDEARTQPKTSGVSRRGGSKEAWNEQDWYVSFGEEFGFRTWEDARKYGFVSAGGGDWFSKTLKKLPLGAPHLRLHPENGLCRRRHRHRTSSPLRRGRSDRRRGACEAVGPSTRRFVHPQAQHRRRRQARIRRACRVGQDSLSRARRLGKGHVRKPEQRLQVAEPFHARAARRGFRRRAALVEFAWCSRSTVSPADPRGSASSARAESLGRG